MKGDTDGAIEDVNRAMQLGPPHPEDFYARRGSYREKKGDLDGALVDYDEAIRLCRLNLPELDLSLWGSMEARAEAREKKGNLAGSVQDYSEMIRMHPDWTNTVDLLKCRARVRERMGDRSGAAQDHKESERLRIHFKVEKFRRDKGRR